VVFFGVLSDLAAHLAGFECNRDVKPITAIYAPMKMSLVLLESSDLLSQCGLRILDSTLSLFR